MNEKNLIQALREVMFREPTASEIAEAPQQHRLRTPQCPPLTRFTPSPQWTADEQTHMADCAYCRMLLQRVKEFEVPGQLLSEGNTMALAENVEQAKATGILTGITREDVLTAISDIESGKEVGVGFGVSWKYDLLHNGKRYPPKKVLGVAARRLLGHPLTPTDFGPPEAIRILRKHGFEIVLKPSRVEIEEVTSVQPPELYTIDHALNGVFLPKAEFQYALDALGRKRNAILQGPPGVGKTFIARRLAYALVGTKDPSRVTMVQFHQSYSYEDFIQGWRPDGSGGFKRKNGVFYEFCKKAEADQKSKYVFIIDEINRGNLSKIFGELFMLIEADKRGPSFAIPLTYARGARETFSVPENLYILGMMNTADRALAMVDYALRRRFAFLDLRPAFHTPEFVSYLEGMGVDTDLIELIRFRMTKLNKQINDQKAHLGPGFEIGHSFFCPQGTEETLDIEWYRSVVRTEVAPLVREYWFDDPGTADSLIKELLA